MISPMLRKLAPMTDRLVAEFLVVVVDLGHGVDAGIVGGSVVLAGVLLVPVEDAADERRDQGDLGLGAGDRLVQAEEQRQIAVDALFFEDPRRPGCLPMWRRS